MIRPSLRLCLRWRLGCIKHGRALIDVILCERRPPVCSGFRYNRGVIINNAPTDGDPPS